MPMSYFPVLRKDAFNLLISLIIGCLFPLAGNASELAINLPAETTGHKLINNADDRIKEAISLINAGLHCRAESILLEISGQEIEQRGMAYFMLGRLYNDLGLYEKAEQYLAGSEGFYPLLVDYARKLLNDVYVSQGMYEEAVATSQLIRNHHLMQYAMQSEINLLLVMNKDKDTKEAFYEYIRKYPEDWDYKLTFAAFLNSLGDINEAISVYKDIYISAVPMSEDALDALKIMEADILTTEETLQLADNLFKHNDYEKAETLYKEVRDLVDRQKKTRIMFSIGMSRFRLKRYSESAESFGFAGTPKWMYWRARSFYRIDDQFGFNSVKNAFEKTYPGNKRLALLYLMEADEMRRQGNLAGATKSYEKVVSRFSESAEDALWGLGWMNYSAGNYKNALNYFSKLTDYDDDRQYYKYLYWKARSQEKITEECVKSKDIESDSNNEECNESRNFFSGLPSDGTYYGYLIKLQSASGTVAEKIHFEKPARPDGDKYRRIEALAFMGMRDEAIEEIVYALKRAKTDNQLFYLGYMAMELEKYKEVIYFAEPRDETEFLPYSYPLAYDEIIDDAAESEGLDKYLIAALIREESRYDPEVVSWAGAVGLMQLMPATANQVNNQIKAHIKDSSNLHDVKTNIFFGAHYLAGLMKEYEKIPFAIIAYNAGGSNLKKWLTRYYKDDITEFVEHIPYKETKGYIKKVLKSYWQYRNINGLPVKTVYN